MKARRYNGYLYVMIYLLLLRVVLFITTGLSVFNLGILFDTVLMMFWVSAIAFLLRRRVQQKIYYIFVVVVSTIFVVGDSVYYDYFGIISSKASLAGIKFLSEGQTLEYDISIPLVAYLITPLLIGTIYLIIANKKRDVFRFRDFGILSIVFVVQVVLFLVWGSYQFENRIDYYRSDAYLFETMHDRKGFSQKYGYYNYHLLDIVRFRWEPDYDEMINDIDLYFDAKEEHQTNDMSDQFAGYNIVTILAESMDTRFISETLTPNLYMMREQGYSFSNYYTPVFQQGATCNSEFMSLTGLLAITTNDWSNNVCDAYSENSFDYALPYQLNDIGYDTYYFHSGYEWFYNRKTMIPNYGFEMVKFQEDMYDLGYSNPLEEDSLGEPFVDRYDTDMLHFFTEFVDYDNPIYVNLLTYSGHGAYNQEDFDIYLDQVNTAYPNNEFEYEIINYMEKMVELDNMIGLVMDELEANGELDETLFVIFPDHFPYMLDHEIYTEHTGIDITDKELKRQTLIMYAQGMTPGVFEKPGSTVDITPTILNMVDSDGDFTYFMGQDLFSNEDNYVIFSDLSITDGNSYLYMDKTTSGDSLIMETFEYYLERKIEALEIQKKILNSNYFEYIENN
jgi:phosphoglycerol transferase MdoB-like AlkP superfamily enzyme